MASATAITRRDFLHAGLLAAAAASLARSPIVAKWVEAAQPATTNSIVDAFNGLVAFVVPGPDSYSTAQGVATPEPGGVDAGVTQILIATVDASTPFLPQFSATVAAVLNGLAQAVNPSAAGPFVSPFARLSFAEKVAVFQIMDGTESLATLAGVLPALVAFFCYSEAGSFDAATRSLTGHPVGWRISSYRGVADGRDELLGYFPTHRPV